LPLDLDGLLQVALRFLGAHSSQESHPLHIVVGGVDNDDKATLDRVGRRNGRVKQWNVPKGAMPGDDIVIYIGGFGLYSTGVVDGSPVLREDWKNRYKAPVRNIRLIAPPVSLKVLLSEIPELSWARYPRSITTPEEKVAAKVVKLIKQRRSGHLASDVSEDLDGLNLAELRHLAIRGSATKTRKVNRKANYRIRSAAIRNYVMSRSHGVCESCRSDAPFITANGMPYLEAHHTTRLSDDGPDHPLHVIALCPNCHRRAHNSVDYTEFNRKLIAKLKKMEGKKTD